MLQAFLLVSPSPYRFSVISPILFLLLLHAEQLRQNLQGCTNANALRRSATATEN
jgi:hypothetical protein